MRRSFVFRLLSTLVSALLGAGMLATSANAVTNGSLVPDPKTNVPYVVSIWNSEKDNDYKNAEFTCTGTLIAPQVVLTAAHCVTLTTPYFVKVGAGAINDSTSFTAVSSVWVGDKYNSKTHENDIGLLKLVDRFEDIKFPTLASPATAKSINKYSKLRIFGWGMDQNKVYPELLSTSDLALQDALAIKTFGKSFNTKTMMAAGRKIVAENVWSGACYGDSGGPLLTEINGIIVLAGVTSWGSKFCLENKPSIFNRVSFYESQIKNGILALEAQSTVVNRTAPIATIEAELIGQAKPGNTLKCSPGTWKNAVSIQSTWISPARISGSVKADIEVLASDGGSVFKCEVIISSTKASVRRVLSATITGSATLAGNPVISGIPDRATFKSGTTARCEGWNWRTPVDSERVTWFTSSSYSPSVPVNGRQIGTGSSLTFSSSILKDENGRYLICQVTGVKDGFESHFVASKLITTPPSPTIYSVSVNASSLALGGSAYCTYNSYSDVETTQYEWGFESSSGYFSVFTGLSSGRIEITQNLIQQASGRALSCRVTLISSGGQVSKTASTYNTFENLPYTPNVAATISGTPIAGSTAYCNATSNNSYSVTTSYQWGKTSYSGSKSIEGQILGNSSYYTITSTSLSDLAGAYLTCVVTATNSVGNSSGASSIAIAASSVTLPTASAPTVYSQSPSTTSITVKIQIPSITAFNSTTMQAILNVINSPNCTNLQVQPSSTYDCSGLSANTSYIAYISTSFKSGAGSTNRSPNLSFTTNGLNALGLSTPAAPIFTPISATVVRVGLPGIPGFDPKLMSAQLYIWWQTSATSVGIDGSAKTIDVNANTGLTQTGYIVLRRLSDGYEAKSSVVTFTMPNYSALIPTFDAPTPIATGFMVKINNYDSNFNWTTSVSAPSQPGASATISVTGLMTVTGMTAGTSATVTVSNTRTGYISGSNSIVGSSSAVQVITPLPTFGAPQISSVATTSVVVIQPARPSNWLSSYEVIAEVYSSDERTRIGASSEGSYYSPGMSQSVSANNPGGIAPGNTYKVRFALRDTILNRYTYGPFTTFTTSAALTAPSQPSITLITPTTNTLAINWSTPASNGGAPISQYWAYVESAPAGATVGYCSTTGALTCTVSGLLANTTYYVIVSAWNTVNGVNRSSGDQFSPRITTRTLATPAAVVAPEVVINSGTFTSGVLAGSIAPGGSFGVSWRVINTDQISSTVALIDSNGNSASWVGGALVSGTVQDGTYQGSLSIPAGFATGRYLICAIAISSTNRRSASQCGSRSEYVKVAELQVSAAPVFPSKYSGTDAYSGIVPPGSGQFWESGFQNAVSVSVVASSPGEASIVAPFSSSWGGTIVIAVADGMLAGQKLFKAAIFVPVGTPKNKLFTLTWTATSATGQTLVVTEGSFNTGP